MRNNGTYLYLALAALLATLGMASQASAAERSPTIGKLSDNGSRVTLRTERLQQKLLDGGRVRGFRVLRRDDDYQLLRFGRNAAGRRVTESVPLVVSGGVLELGNLKWITVCAQSECKDGFCMPDGDHCDCSSLTVGDGDQDEELVLTWEGAFDVEEGYSSSGHNPGTQGGCTFGMQPADVGVVILH